jgi:hypothetical protein
MNIFELSGSQFLAVAEVLGTLAFAVSAWIAVIQLLTAGKHHQQREFPFK